MHRHDLSALPDGRGWLADRDRRRHDGGGRRARPRDHRARSSAPAEACAGSKLYDDRRSEQHIWEVREAGLGATAFVPGKPDTYEGWEDSAVPPERLGEYLRELKQADRPLRLRERGLRPLRPGLRPCPLELRPRHEAEGIATWRRFMDDAADLVLSLGGSLSGEHGDGQSRAELLPKMFGDELDRGVPRVQVDLGSRLEDEPRQGRRPAPDHLRPPPRAGLPPAGRLDPLRVSRGTAARSPTRPRAASASASAGAPRAA